MTHNMKLQNKPFESIKNGKKTIELRLYDEKRKLINEKDIIVFENMITKELIKTEVVKLHKYSSFEELYKHFDKASLGYNEGEIANSSDMEIYYPKEEQEKNSVLGIEIILLNKEKEEIIYNYDNMEIKDINNVVRRAKIIIETPSKQLILCHSDNNYHLLGGHVENNESDIECLNREIFEEAGVNLNLENLEPFMTIKYLNKNYPKSELNTLTMANYYYLINDIKPDLKNQRLEEGEINGNFTLKYIDKDNAIEVLENSLKDSTRKGVTQDTIDVIKQYLNKEK